MNFRSNVHAAQMGFRSIRISLKRRITIDSNFMQPLFWKIEPWLWDSSQILCKVIIYFSRFLATGCGVVLGLLYMKIANVKCGYVPPEFDLAIFIRNNPGCE